MDRKQELTAAEEKGWNEVNALVASRDDELLERPGVSKDGWSVKDLLWHLGCWSAEASRELERIRMGTYEERDYDTDALNVEFEAIGRTMDLASVKTEFVAARNKALQEWAQVTDLVPEAEEWFFEAGAQHYSDHLPDLRRWAEKLT